MSGIKLTINLNESIKKKLCFKRECLNYFLLLVKDLCTNIYIGYKMNFQLFILPKSNKLKCSTRIKTLSTKYPLSRNSTELNGRCTRFLESSRLY